MENHRETGREEDMDLLVIIEIVLENKVIVSMIISKAYTEMRV